jgi:hypothetical protein
VEHPSLDPYTADAFTAVAEALVRKVRHRTSLQSRELLERRSVWPSASLDSEETHTSELRICCGSSKQVVVAICTSDAFD